MTTERDELLATLAGEGVRLNKTTVKNLTTNQIRAMVSVVRPAERVSLDGWDEVWHASQRPGSLVAFLNWAAEHGYRLVQGDPMPTVDPEWAWMALAAQGTLTDADVLPGNGFCASHQDTTGERFIICDTCGSLEHEAEDCTSELAPGFAFRAYKWHTDRLPDNVEGCKAAGHCGHVPCCNCSGADPDPTVIAATNEAYKASGADTRCLVDGCTRLLYGGGSLCDLHSVELDEHPERFA